MPYSCSRDLYNRSKKLFFSSIHEYFRRAGYVNPIIIRCILAKRLSHLNISFLERLRKVGTHLTFLRIIVGKTLLIWINNWFVHLIVCRKSFQRLTVKVIESSTGLKVLLNCPIRFKGECRGLLSLYV